MLNRLGFKKGRIVEVIVTTYNEDGSPNSAPMGVLSNGKDKIYLRVCKKTDTLRNIIREGCFVVNITTNPMLFLKAALLGKNKAGKEIEVSEVKRSSVNAPYLLEASAYMEVHLEDYKDYIKRDELGETEFCLINGGVTRVNILKDSPEALNRGVFAVIEMAIELSRGKNKNIIKHLSIARKCLSGEEYNEIYSFVKKFIDNL